MKKWRESNSLSVINKGGKYHCDTKGRDLSGMMSHTKDVCVNRQYPLHLAFYLHLQHTFNLKWDASMCYINEPEQEDEVVTTIQNKRIIVHNDLKKKLKQ